MTTPASSHASARLDGPFVGAGGPGGGGHALTGPAGPQVWAGPGGAQARGGPPCGGAPWGGPACGGGQPPGPGGPDGRLGGGPGSAAILVVAGSRGVGDNAVVASLLPPFPLLPP
jgi:translation initiation factor IF-2